MNVEIAKLMGKIVEKGFTVDTLAVAIGINRATLYRKLAAIEKFTIGEARRIKAILELTNEEAIFIFLP
jgi:predicted transcriptional regulator